MDWYYANGGERQGPFDEAEFQRRVQSGIVQATTLVWNEGMSDWRSWRDVQAPPGGGPRGIEPVGPVATQNDLTTSTSLGEVPIPRCCIQCRKPFPESELVSLGGYPYCPTCKPIGLQRLQEGSPVESEVELLRKRHLQHEASVRSVGFLYLLGGSVWVIAAVAIAAPNALQASRPGAGVPAFLGLGLFLLGGGLLYLGISLRRLRPWARFGSVAVSCIGLLGFPFGTLINGYILYLLLCQKGRTVFSEEYRQAVAATPHIKYRTSVVVWILVGLVLLAVAAAVVLPWVARSGF